MSERPSGRATTARARVRPFAWLAGLAALVLVAAAVDVRVDGKWSGSPAELAVRVLEEPDRDARRLALEYRSPWSSQVARLVRPLGGREVAAAAVVGLGLFGWLRRRPWAVRLAADLLLASVLSAALAVGIQCAAGRSRPSADLGVAAFNGPSLDRRERSFPSGHATQAFALAAVISGSVPSPAVATGAWGLAALVALSRVHDDRHFFSDVVAGGLLGSATSLLVLRRRRAREAAPGRPARPPA